MRCLVPASDLLGGVAGLGGELGELAAVAGHAGQQDADDGDRDALVGVDALQVDPGDRVGDAGDGAEQRRAATSSGGLGRSWSCRASSRAAELGGLLPVADVLPARSGC